MGNTARDWPLAEAKAKFSELVAGSTLGSGDEGGRS